MWEEGNDYYTELVEGGEYCVNGRVSFDAFYGDCDDRRRSPVKTVDFEHFVGTRRTSKKTEISYPYFVYGDDDKGITFSNAILGAIKITAVVNGSKRSTRRFTLKKC